MNDLNIKELSNDMKSDLHISGEKNTAFRYSDFKNLLYYLLLKLESEYICKFNYYHILDIDRDIHLYPVYVNYYDFNNIIIKKTTIEKYKELKGNKILIKFSKTSDISNNGRCIFSNFWIEFENSNCIKDCEFYKVRVSESLAIDNYRLYNNKVDYEIKLKNMLRCLNINYFIN